MDVSVVVPLYNEIDNVDELCAGIRTALGKSGLDYEIIFVDDGSTDGTVPRLRALKSSEPRLKLIIFKRNYGQTEALAAGFDHASGDVIITMDGDLQNDPADIPRLLQKIEQGFDVVSGWRQDRKDSPLRRLLSRAANLIISYTTNVRLHDHGCTLKAYRPECVKALNLYGEMHRFIPVMACMAGASVAEIPVRHHFRQRGRSKYGYSRILKVFSDIFAINLVIRAAATPLRGFAQAALPFLVMTLCFGGLLGAGLLYGWASPKLILLLIATALSALTVANMVLLGILGELVVSNSDLSHTRLPVKTKKPIIINHRAQNQ